MNFDINKTLKNVSKVKLPGGVVGKVCTVLIVVTLTIGGLAALSHETWLLGVAVGAIILIVFPMLWRLINFADKNPQAAILEGAEFLMHQQILMGSKATPYIPASIDVSVDDRSIVISKELEKTLSLPEETAVVVEPINPDKSK